MSFNEISKNLRPVMGQSEEDQINALAKDLFARKLATSMMDAHEKAKNMVISNRRAKVQKSPSGVVYNDPRNNPNYVRNQGTGFRTPHQEREARPKMVETTEEVIRVRAPEPQAEPEPRQETLPEPEPQQYPQMPEQEERPATPEPEESTAPDEEPGQDHETEQETEAPEEEKKPEKEKKQNPTVDINAMFNYGKR